MTAQAPLNLGPVAVTTAAATPAEPPPPEKPGPERDFWNLWAVEQGAPEGWQWKNLEGIDSSGTRHYVRIEGAVFRTLFQSGKRKGTPNFRKPEAGTQRIFIVEHAEFLAWKTAWLKARGFCLKCDGEGRLLVSWHFERGPTYRACPAGCDDGKARLREVPAP